MFPLDANSFSQLFSESVLIFALASVANGVLLFFASVKFLLAFQQSGYRAKRYYKWLNAKENSYLSRLMLLCMLGFLFFCVLAMCFASVVGYLATSYVGFASYLLFIIVYINTESNVNAKIPLKMTARLIRLSVSYYLILTAVSFGLIVLLNYVSFLIDDTVVCILRYSLVCAIPILCPYLLTVAYAVNEPFEFLIRRHFISLANAKISNSSAVKIGITGSYAKTSVKEILKTILSQKYRVLATPESYNTPLGIALTVRELDSTHDVFITEMGARSKGDVTELAKLVKPEIGVLTGVNSQHLESFENIENIKNTKYELFENLKPDGKGFFSSDNAISLELMERFGNEKYSAGENGSLVSVEEMVTTKSGTEFTLSINGEKIKCFTVLLGRHSISNIALASAVAYKVGLTVKEIAEGISRLRSVGHRLEIVPNNKDIVIIDDSYNSNINGTEAAMEVLDLFEGRKIVLTPGLVELGKEENLANLNFGRLLAKHADKVIIIGKHNAEMLINGLKEGGMDVENITFAKSLKKGNDLLNEMLVKGDIVLFENDLPDNYS